MNQLKYENHENEGAMGGMNFSFQYLLEAWTDAASNTCKNMSSSNTCIQLGCRNASNHCCLNTIIAGTGHILDAGNNAATSTCMHPKKLLSLAANMLASFFCFNTMITGNGNAFDAGNDAASYTCNHLSAYNTYI